MALLIVVIFLIVMVLFVDFSIFSEWHELDSELQESELFPNKAYGAYKIRKTNPLALLLVVLICTLLAGVWVGYERIDFSGKLNKPLAHDAQQQKDSIAITFALAEINMQSPPSPFSEKGNNGDNMPVNQSGAERGEDGTGEYEPQNNTSSNESDPNYNGYDDDKYAKRPNESVADYERRMKDEIASGGSSIAKAKAEKEKAEREQKKRDQDKAAQNVNGGKGGVSGQNTGSKGDTEVTWKIGNRDAYNGKSSYVKVPAYTCGEGVNAKVVIKVKVDSEGNVVSAINTSTGANVCCVKKALEYAKKSRFETSDKAFEEGTITYLFKAQ